MKPLTKFGQYSTNKISTNIGRYLCNSLNKEQREKLRRFVRNFYNQLENFNYDFKTNGEERVLSILKSMDVKTIFDVGANIGNWSRIAIELFQDAEIHCFEIAPDTFNTLIDNLNGYNRIIFNNIGLSSTAGEVYFNYAGKDSGLTSIEPVLWQATEKIKSYVSTGTQYAVDKNIDRIDLLKIDTESHDFFVLQGFKEFFEQRKIKFVQFEYGRGSIDTKKLLKDHYNFFEKYGFLVGKIYPKYVEFKPYSYAAWDEDFVGPNYVAINQSEKEAISRLSNRNT